MSSMTTDAADALDGAPCPTSVYRYYDRHGLLIYVGITKQGMGRNLQHNNKAEWWQYVVRQEVEHYATRLAAVRREKQLIHDSRPPFNKQHNAGHEDLRAAYLRIISVPPPEESPAQQLRRHRGKLPLDVVSHNETLLLRSRIEDEPLASLLIKAEGGVPIIQWGTGLRLGWVLRVDVVGTFAYLSCQPNKAMPVAIGDIRATLKFHTKKPQRAEILRLHVWNAEGPVVG